MFHLETCIMMTLEEILLIVATCLHRPLMLEMAHFTTRITLFIGVTLLLYLGVVLSLVAINISRNIANVHVVVVARREVTGRGEGGDMTPHMEAAIIAPLERGVQNLIKVLRTV